MKKSFLQNDVRAIMTYNIIGIIQKLQLFKNKKTIVNIGSFDLIESDNIDLGLELLNALNIESTQAELTNFIDKKRISSKILWDKLGFSESIFIDPDGVHNSLTYDLNFTIKEEKNFHKTFDVVANFGTSEHIFNQFAVFQNIHTLCNNDGIMIHSLPLQGAFEHGLYNYHPNFFYALAHSNNYKIEYFGVRHKDLENYNLVDIDSELIKPFLMQICAYDTLASVVIFRKLTDEEFKIPFQGRYELHQKNT